MNTGIHKVNDDIEPMATWLILLSNKEQESLPTNNPVTERYFAAFLYLASLLANNQKNILKL